MDNKSENREACEKAVAVIKTHGGSLDSGRKGNWYQEVKTVRLLMSHTSGISESHM